MSFEKENAQSCDWAFVYGDPDGIRTRVTAVKGRCLRPLDHRAINKGASVCLHLTGSGSGIRTYDQSGMNRVL